MIVRITALCVAASMICSALRIQRPEMATAVSLAAGLAAVAMLFAGAGEAARWLESIKGAMGGDGNPVAVVLKGAGITVVAQMGAQLCRDAGESALAGRIELASRVALLGLCAPLFSELFGMFGSATP